MESEELPTLRLFAVATRTTVGTNTHLGPHLPLLLPSVSTQEPVPLASAIMSGRSSHHV